MASPTNNSTVAPQTTDQTQKAASITGKKLTPEAERALAEAAERRAAIDNKARALTEHREINGRGGLEPVRYDDWEVKGIACDF